MTSPRQKAFAEQVLRFVNDGLTHMQAVTIVCEQFKIDHSKVNGFIDDHLRERITQCCIKHKTHKDYTTVETTPTLCK